MDIVETDVSGVLVVEPRGGIDSSNAKVFAARVVDSFNARQCNLVIDFQKVKYISSAGFRSLLIIGKTVESAKRKLVLCGMGPEVRRVFEIAMFNELFVICGSREDAAQQAT
jgi:anti-anti-sigma factor